MDNDKKEFIFLGIIIGGILLATTIFCAVLSKIGCEAAWQDSGRKIDWSLIGGCRVSDKNGNFIPASNIRDIQ